MPTLLLYEDVEAINRDVHRDLKLKPLVDYRFAAKVQAVPIVPAEFFLASREYPILFTPDGQGGRLPVALLGLRKEENLFVDENGQWRGHYVPAFIRRHPFVFAETGPQQLTLCIDKASPRLTTVEGDALFEADGAPAPRLKESLALLQEYQAQVPLLRRFTERLSEADLFTASDARTTSSSGSTYAVTGIEVVNEHKFRELDGERLKTWFAGGELDLVYAHLFSLRNLQDLGRHLEQRLAKEAAAAAA